MREETAIRKAEFSPKVKPYMVLSSTLGFAATIIGILFLPIWIPISLILSGRYLRSLECILTEKTLRVKRGILFKVEKTIPLDKITDLGASQGPIMRAFGIENITIETAGSSAPGALVSLPGIVDPQPFRDAVLTQKDKLVSGQASTANIDPAPAVISGGSDLAETNDLLREIRDLLKEKVKG